MPNLFKNFVRGAAEGGYGVTNAILEGLRQEKERKALERLEKSRGIMDALNQARLDSMNKPKPFEPKYTSYSPGSTVGYHDQSGKFIETAKIPDKPEKSEKPKEITMSIGPNGPTFNNLTPDTDEETKKLIAAQLGYGLHNWQEAFRPKPKPVKAEKPAVGEGQIYKDLAYGDTPQTIATRANTADSLANILNGSAIKPQATAVPIPSKSATPGNNLTEKADELVRQGVMTPEEREQYRLETGN